jgi:hypothetical protein
MRRSSPSTLVSECGGLLRSEKREVRSEKREVKSEKREVKIIH